MASYWGDKSMDPDSLYSVLNMRMRITNFLNSSYELKSTQALLEKQKKKTRVKFWNVCCLFTCHSISNTPFYKKLLRLQDIVQLKIRFVLFKDGAH